MDPTEAKANYSRVCQLLVNKGGDVLRAALHAVHPPSTLAAVLNANKKTLQRIRYSVIKPPQWNLLFPVSGTPDSSNFDITLLTVLLRNVCGLFPPVTGWNGMPPASDTSISANVLRIKIFRNEVYGHIPSAQLDDTMFEALWQEISGPLINLGIPQKDIDELKVAPLSPEEESYIEQLREWKQQEDDFMSKLNDVESEIVELRKTVESISLTHVEQLAKFDFTGKIDSLSAKFQDGTRKWLFDKLARWFRNNESRVMILTAGPGVGKSVLSAKVCEVYKQRGQLAAHHFCDFRNHDYSNPHRILQSLASQMCDNVDGFSDNLTEVLRREHSRDSLSDAFRVLLSDPLHALRRHEPLLIVVDALDESKTDAKSEFLELISDNFCELPNWMKIVITSRPELQVQNELKHLNPLEIRPDDKHHNLDIEHFIRRFLPNINEDNISFLVSRCEGSFLYAYYLVSELEEKGLGFEPNLSDYVPKGISGFYEKQFKRLKLGLQRFKQDTWSCILNSFINVVAASREPLPINIIFTCMGLPQGEYEFRKAIIDIMSEILPIYDDCLTVYHKSLWDWLTLDGYEEHAFVADVVDGNERLWSACKNIFCEVDLLRSVLDFQISPEKMYALNNGGKYLVNAGAVGEFHWLVHVGVNFLKLKFSKRLNDDFSKILGTFKSKLPDNIYWGIIQLHGFYRMMGEGRRLRSIIHAYGKEICYVYLQSLANGHFDFLQYPFSCKNGARDILNTAKEIWIEQVTDTSNCNFRIVSNTVFTGSSFHIALSPDNKLLACLYIGEHRVQVLKLPSLATIFELHVDKIHPLYSECFFFSPDSSYILCNSIRFCICIKEQKEVPFIPHGPDDIQLCSFSSCGGKLVTVEEKLLKVWDVNKKDVLVEVKNMYDFPPYCLFSVCNSYILVWPRGREGSDLPIMDYMAILQTSTLERVRIKNVSVAQCLTDEDSFQLFSPRYSFSDLNVKFRIHHLRLPTGQIVLISNKYCSKTVTWKNRKCVAFTDSLKGALSLVVYDFVNQKIVDVFRISSFYSYTPINYMAILDETNLLISSVYNQAFVLSLEALADYPNAPYVDNAPINCRALSPDTLYVACCYENCILSIRSVGSGETLQTFELKQPAVACWWSESYLWLVCKGVVVKYSSELKHGHILGSPLEEYFVNFESVLKFAEGVLVICVDRKISILKICDEMLCQQQIPDYSFDASVAISSDGCAVLLCRRDIFESNYQLWVTECGNRWVLCSAGRLKYLVEWFCLTGTRESRSAILITSDGIVSMANEVLHLHSIEFPSGSQEMHDLPIVNFRGAVYICSDIVAVLQDEWMHIVKVSEGEIITSRYLGNVAPLNVVLSSFYLTSTGLLLLVDRNSNKYFNIHNLKKYFPFLTKQ